MLSQLFRRRMEGIPTSTPQRGITLLRLSPPALGTQQLVRFHCLASLPATSTPLLALERLILTPRIQIRPLALQRFCLTPPAQKTRPMEPLRLNLTKPARKTARLAPLPTLTTLPPTTLRLVLERSLTTLVAASTRLWVRP